MFRRLALPCCLAISIALLIIVIEGCEEPREGDTIGPRGAASDTVSVTITGDTLPLTVDPDPVYVDRGTLVEWSHAGVDSFEIDLLRAPMVPVLIKGRRGEDAQAVVPQFAPEGTFKYSVTVYVNGDRITEDPRIICCGDAPANGDG